MKVLTKHPEAFQGGLGTLNVQPVHLEVLKDAVPYHARAFPVPKAYEKTTKKEVDRLTEIGVLERNSDSEWASPTFIQPKKTGDVRVLTDFRKLNDAIKRTPFPMPKISDLLQKLDGFKWATAIDLSMGYYHIPLDEESQKLCTTVMPWGKYRYKRLPMGIKNSPDIFQKVITDLMGDFDWCRAYMDDILITSSDSYEDHLLKVDKALSRLNDAGFRVNLKKSFFAVDKIEYLGYWLTRDGIQPQPKKVEAIRRLDTPKTKRQLRRFLGMINYYRDMWRRRSHILAPLTGLISKKVTFKWETQHQKAFEEIKDIISRETLLSFPDFNKEFHIHTDASDYQLGAVIMQENKPLAFYSRKVNSAQKRYTTGEQELLSIVETLKEFRNILLGQSITVHTDHKNLLYAKLPSDRMVRWRLLLEEYGVKLVHIKGEDNVIADGLSRLDFNSTDDSDEMNDTETSNAMRAFPISQREEKETDFPLFPPLIRKHQLKDKQLEKQVQKNSKAYTTAEVEGVELIHKDGKICIPFLLQQRVVAWYHEYLAHPGQTRTEATIRQHFTWPKLRQHVELYTKTCSQCQLCKKQRKKYGHLPAKNAEATPWEEVHVDLVGPYTVKGETTTRKLQCLTMIDPATGWFEIKAVPNKQADTVMDAFHNAWLSRYPRSKYIRFDNGGEFKGVFDEMVENYGLTTRPTTSYNPQSNGIIERVHQVVGNSLRTLEVNKAADDPVIADDEPWDNVLSQVAWAIRSTYHTTLEATPGQLVFNRDMLLPIESRINWANIKSRKQDLINANNRRENKRRFLHTYKEGDLVLLDKPGIIPKMDVPRTGPHTVIKVYTNGTVRISRGPIKERVNIRRLSPYHERSN